MNNSLFRTISLAKRGINNFFLKRPFCVSFEVTYRCNARCEHCHLGGPVDEVRATPQRYGEICDELKPVVAQVSGGEPLLRKDLEKIIEALANRNDAPYVVVTTNGVLLTRERYISLRQAGVDEFSLSLDFPDERHDEFRHVPGLFHKIKNLMEELSSEDKAVTLSGVVNRKNYKDLISMAELAQQWGVRINFSTYTWLRTKKKEYLIPQEEIPELRRIIKRLLQFKKKYGTVYPSGYVFQKMVEFFEKESIPDCRAGEKFFVVNPDGSLSPCGLIIKNYKTQKEMQQDFLGQNTCSYCYTSIRANSEKPAKYLIRDSLKSL